MSAIIENNRKHPTICNKQYNFAKMWFLFPITLQNITSTNKPIFSELVLNIGQKPYNNYQLDALNIIYL